MNNNDLISRAWVLAEYDRQHKGPPGGARKIMAEAPAVDAVPVVQRWISVKDRLPEVAGWYLVFYNESAMQVAFFKSKTWPFNNHYHTITHWMPLPEPPKMDGEADG